MNSASKGIIIKPIPNQKEKVKFDISDDNGQSIKYQSFKPAINIVGGLGIGIAVGLSILIMTIFSGLSFNTHELSLIIAMPAVLGAVAGYIVLT